MKTNLSDGIYCLRLFDRKSDKIAFDLLKEPQITKDMIYDPDNFVWETIHLDTNDQFDTMNLREIFLVKVKDKNMEIYNDVELLKNGVMSHKEWDSYMVKMWASIE